MSDGFTDARRGVYFSADRQRDHANKQKTEKAPLKPKKNLKDPVKIVQRELNIAKHRMQKATDCECCGEAQVMPWRLVVETLEIILEEIQES